MMADFGRSIVMPATRAVDEITRAVSYSETLSREFVRLR